VGAVVFAIGLAGAAETEVAHALLARFSVRGAWMATVPSVYALV